MRAPTHMPSQHNFARVPDAEIPRSRFDRSHGHKTTFDAGYLIPFFSDEILPGDTHTLKANIQARLNTPYFPIMDNAYLTTFFFFVPSRLVWTNFQRFNGEQANPGDSTSFLVPISTAPAGGYAFSSLQNYFGLRAGVAGYIHNTLRIRAYNLIYNTWFRDENLQNSRPLNLGDGPDTVTDYILMKRGKRHDYFTSCLPWPQKGAAVSLPLSGNAPVVTTNTAFTFTTAVTPATQMNFRKVNAAGSSFDLNPVNTDTNAPLRFGATTGLQVDMSAVTAATINQLRQAFQLQRLLERDARGGTRYIEILRSHFGVVSPDFRLQRPEYLGGARAPLIISSVPQTSATEAGQSPQGNLAAFGTISAQGGGHGFTKSFVEHGYVIGLLHVGADLTYQQGLDRSWSRTDRWSFYWPALSHLGEQSVFNREIFVQGTAADANVFGYQEAWAEYRYKPSLVTGEFNSDFAQSLDAWHLAQDFTALPVLNDSFIQDDPPFDRVTVVPTAPHFKADMYFTLISARPMPTYSVPGLIDHF